MSVYTATEGTTVDICALTSSNFAGISPPLSTSVNITASFLALPGAASVGMQWQQNGIHIYYPLLTL